MAKIEKQTNGTLTMVKACTIVNVNFVLELCSFQFLLFSSYPVAQYRILEYSVWLVRTENGCPN